MAGGTAEGPLPRESGLSATVMLVCAVLASLALGVLVAYGVCGAMFRVFRMHSISVAKQRALAGRGVSELAG
jgi:hypothetical protein